MKKILVFITIIALLLIIVPVLVAGYFGFVPVVSDIMGTNKPIDLGIKATKQHYDEGIEKLGVIIKKTPSLPDGRILAHEGTHAVKSAFTSEEITAMSQNHPRMDFPLSNTQFKINTDGSFEMSTVLKIGPAMKYLSHMGVSPEDIDKAFSIAQLPKADIPLYAKGTGEVQDNAVNTSLQSLQAGRFPIPQEIVTEYNDEIDSVLSLLLEEDVGARVRSMRAQDGTVFVDGDFPDTETILEK